MSRVYQDIHGLPHQEQYDVITLLRQIADRLEEQLSVTLTRDVRASPREVRASDPRRHESPLTVARSAGV